MNCAQLLSSDANSEFIYTVCTVLSTCYYTHIMHVLLMVEKYCTELECAEVCPI